MGKLFDYVSWKISCTCDIEMRNKNNILRVESWSHEEEGQIRSLPVSGFWGKLGIN
jgi:hypothetical protein